MEKRKCRVCRVWHWITDRCKRLVALLRLPRVRKILFTVTSFLLATVFLVGAFACIISSAVCKKVEDRIKTPQEIAQAGGKYDLILVLGCLVHSDGTLSQMLDDRVTVATRLFLDGASDLILMSGDHQSSYYNEVDPMRNLAIELGAEPEKVRTDPYGLSTYESVYRLLSAYQGKRILIVTQEYHLYRALYIAEKLGIEADGAIADQHDYQNQWRRDLREIFARCKDVFLCAAEH